MEVHEVKYGGACRQQQVAREMPGDTVAMEGEGDGRSAEREVYVWQPNWGVDVGDHLVVVSCLCAGELRWGENWGVNKCGSK